MPSRGESAKVTTDHRAIRRWVEERGGFPAKVMGTGRKADPGILRVDYPGYSGVRNLKQISWDEFFDKFEESNLAFLYQNETATGRRSRFSKLVGRETVQAERNGSQRATGRRSGKVGSKTAAKSKAGRKSPSTRTSRAAETTRSKSRSTGAASKRNGAKKRPSKRSSPAARATSSARGSARKTSAGRGRSSTRQNGARSTRGRMQSKQ